MKLEVFKRSARSGFIGAPLDADSSIRACPVQVPKTLVIASASKEIDSVGIFDKHSSGELYFKSDFVGLALEARDSIEFTVKITLS